MMKIGKRILLGLAAFMALSILITVVYLARGGAFKTIESEFEGACVDYPLDGSAEDIHIDRERGIAYLSVLDRMGVARGEPPKPGNIMALDLNTMELGNALATTTDHMSPHGISLYISPTGERTLFMINHPADRVNGTETINRYTETSPGQFSLTQVLSHPDVISPNDLVAVGPKQVYVANDKGAANGWQKFLENIFGVGYSKLVYFDGDEGSTVLDDVASGGGINASTDGTLIYIGETGGQTLRVLNRAADGSLTDATKVKLGTSPDNVDVAADGSLTIAAHPNLMALIKHFINGTPAPSQVLHVTTDSDDALEYDVEEIYLNTGEQISASSVGATYKNKLLIGSITAKKVLICTMEDGLETDD